MTRLLNRREFIAASSLFCLSAAHAATESTEPVEPIIDIHQHTTYGGRSNEDLIAHQKAMGVTRTILLPAGREVQTPSTHDGQSNGLAVQCGGNERCLDLAWRFPKGFSFFANEVPDLPDARQEVEKYLKLGALGIGEQKFGIACDSEPIERVAELARKYGVPVLLHFQHEMYNLHFERFHRVLEKFPRVNFIGHAQTWWGNIDRNHDFKVLYPTGKVAAGGITDRYLKDFPNMFGDLSAGSGLNALLRDEEHTRGFLERHQDKLLFGSDCKDRLGRGPGCQGAQIIAAIRRLAPSMAIERKLLCQNAKKLFRV